MGQSLHSLTVLCIACIWIGFQNRASAQDLHHQSINHGGASYELVYGDSRFAIRSSVGQSTIIGQSISGELSGFQGFIQPKGIRSHAVESEPLNIDVYPNPTHGRVYLQNREAKAIDIAVVITDIYGQVVLHRRDISISLMVLDLSDLSAGYYVLRVTDGQRNFTTKINKL